MLDYCPNCRCKIRFYKAHECDKMKHDLADSIKLAGDVIASGDECKLKENTTHGIFRIWCVIKNIIEIICDIIKRMKCLQRKAQKVCEVQHCLADRIESVNRFIGVYNSDQANKPSPDQSNWEAEKRRLESDYQASLNGYNARRAEYERALQAYNNSNSNYASALASYNARKADYERRKREYEAGNNQQGGSTKWQEAWGTFQRNGAPLDVAMGGSPNGSVQGIDLSEAHRNGYGQGIGFTSKNNEGTIVDIQLNLLGYSYEAGVGGRLQGWYVQYGGTYDWYFDVYASTDGGNNYSVVQKDILLAKHADTQKLAYEPNWHLSTIKWNKTFTNLPANFTHLKVEVRGSNPGDRHQNVYTREQIIRAPFPPFTEQPPVNNATKPKPFNEQPPQRPTIPPKPEKKVETIPLIKGGCDLMDCKFDCFIDDK